MMRQRLGFLAAELARRRNQGWRIAHVEWSPEPGSAALEVDGAAVGLRGKIDRIDVRDAEWAVVDYKTGRAPSGKIESTHFQERKKRWINLQLPLYRLLIAGLEPPEHVHLGLCYLPRKAGEDALRFCSWDQEHLAGAEEAARDVVRQMRSLRAGDAIELGDTPPSEGALGWMTGERFVRGVDDDEEDDGEDAA
jgi:RecB family exonuclease